MDYGLVCPGLPDGVRTFRKLSGVSGRHCICKSKEGDLDEKSYNGFARGDQIDKHDDKTSKCIKCHTVLWTVSEAFILHGYDLGIKVEK